jgi:hypothetical protein
MKVAWIVAAGVLVGGLGSCSRRGATEAPSTPTSSPSTSSPSPAPDDDAALKMLRDLQAMGEQGRQEEDHGRLSQVADAIGRLQFHKRENLRRRDDLAEKYRREAATVRGGLHRFLFVEVNALDPQVRRDLLEVADRGDPRALEQAGASLAEHDFQAGRRFLRATPDLPAGTTDPATGLSVLPAGNLQRIWQRKFNAAFNARMRELVPSRTQVP